MPNHVKNILKTKDIMSLPIFTKDDDDTLRFDFNTLVPMPPELNIASGTITKVAMRVVDAALQANSTGIPELPDEVFDDELDHRIQEKSLRDEIKRTGKTAFELMTLGVQYYQNLYKHGYTTWYDWCCANWGCKWNSYDLAQLDNDTVVFTTPWSPPLPVLKTLAEQNPDREIEHWWADEDVGSNTGHTKYIGGVAVEQTIYDLFTQDAYETYIQCWEGPTPCMAKDANDMWYLKNCDDCEGC